MTIKDLRKKLADYPDDCQVMICDIEDDSDESFNFHDIEGIEYAPDSGTIVALLFNTPDGYPETL